CPHRALPSVAQDEESAERDSRARAGNRVTMMTEDTTIKAKTAREICMEESSKNPRFKPAPKSGRGLVIIEGQPPSTNEAAIGGGIGNMWEASSAGFKR